MIARTEISRVQNTGILQSYINEGYTEVKILTAEDNNVCTTCLKYAFDFNKDEKITFENRGKERVHNIIKLIKGDNFPPFHPLCRCTYLSVWGTKTKPPEDPYIINLTPMKFSDSTGEILLPDGKPEIKWTEETLEKELSEITDSKLELNKLTEEIMEYMNTIENRNEESLSAMDRDLNMVCTQHSLGKLRGVNLCDKGKTAAKKIGLLFVIHNHPSNNPLQSEGDVEGFADYNVKYNIVFTEKEGLLIFKNDNAIKENIPRGWKDTYNAMLDDLKGDYSSEYYHIVDLYRNGGLKDDEFGVKVYKEVLNHMSNNIGLSIDYFTEHMGKYGVDVMYIKP